MIRTTGVSVNWGHGLTRNLVGWWLSQSRLTPNTQWGDLAGAPEARMTMTNAPTWGGGPWRPGAMGPPLSTTAASSQRMSTPTTATLSSLASASQPMSFAIWVRLAALPTAWTGLMTKGRGGTPWWGFWISDANETVLGFGGSSNAIGPVLVAGAWTHFLGTVTGQVGTLYINGASAASVSSIGDQSTTADLWIGGAESVSEYATGQFDDARVWSRALASDEVRAVYIDSCMGSPATLHRPRRWKVAAA